jgi:ABC-2 type transport system permease protein
MSTTGEASQVSPWRAAWLLSRLRLRRQWNQIRSASLFRGASPARTGTRRKSSLGWIFTAFVILAMVGNFANMAHWGMANLEKALGSVEVYKEVQRGWLGVQVGPVTADIASRLGVVPSRGAVINSMAEAGPAKSAGLQAQDVIVSFDARQVRDANDLSRMASATPVGKNVEVVFIRAGAQQRKIVRLGTLPEDAQPSVRAIAPAPGTVLAPGVLHGAAIEVMLLGLATLFVVLASREIVQPEWDLEWLVTLPLPLSTLLLGRLVERAVTNSAGILILGPFLSVIAWECGLRWSAPLVGIGFTFALLFVVATFQTLVDTGLRLSLPPPKLRNLQAVISLVSMLPMLLAFSIAMPGNSLLLDWVPALPGWIDVLPTGLAVRALAAADGSSMALWSAAMLGEIAAFVAIGYAVLQRQLRYGVVATGGREAVARRPREKRDAGGVLRGAQALLSAVQRRELILLGRDRTFMVQTLVLPVVVVGTQVFLNARTNILAAAIEHPENLAAIAFALPAYMLMLSAFQTLNAEGQALWILYAVPQPLELILRQKARLWAAAAMIYPLIILAVAVGVSGQVTVAFAGSAAIVLVGVPIFAVIATALGVFGCDPLATEVHRRIRLTYSYLYMLLVSLYVYAVYASTIWQRAATVILTALLALALWQKARDRFDYLLDPTASPPARVSVSDGLIAALMFFVVQALVIVFFQVGKFDVPAAQIIWIAFCTAGAITYGAIRFVYWRTKTAGVPRTVGPGLPRALLVGVAGGIVASLAGLAYIEIAASVDLLSIPRATQVADRLWLGGLVIAAAPVFEEFIFRGLIFGGLRRSLGPAAATLASAAIFAIVHPPMSAIPVFFMAICAAVVYERTKVLAAAMAVHAVYNAAVLGFQWNLMQ